MSTNKTFINYLIETMNETVPYHWVYKHPDMWRAELTINDITYFVLFSQDEDIQTRWHVVFDIENRPDTDELYSLTGTGNVYVLFGTLLQLVTEFSRKNPNVASIVFTADEESRKRFYNRWSQILAKTLGNWLLKITQRSTNKYTLTRPRK